MLRVKSRLPVPSSSWAIAHAVLQHARLPAGAVGQVEQHAVGQVELAAAHPGGLVPGALHVVVLAVVATLPAVEVRWLRGDVGRQLADQAKGAVDRAAALVFARVVDVTRTGGQPEPVGERKRALTVHALGFEAAVRLHEGREHAVRAVLRRESPAAVQHVEADAVLFLEIEQSRGPEQPLVRRARQLQLVLRPLVSRVHRVARIALHAVAVELALVELGVAADVAQRVTGADADVEPRSQAVGVEVQVAGGRRIVHAMVEVLATDVAGALVAKVLEGEEPADVLVGLEHRADAVRAEVRRAVLAVGVELVVRGEGRAPVLLLDRAGRAQRPLVADRDVHHAAEAEQRVAARDDLARGVEVARVGLRRMHRDRAAGRVAAEQRALWAAQDLDTIEVVEHHGRALRAGREYPVRVEGNALVARFRLVSRAEAADEDQRYRVVAVLEELQVRHEAAHVEQRDDAILVQRRLVERADRERRVLQRGFSPRCGDDDVAKNRPLRLRGRLGLCSQDRGQAHRRAA